MRVHAPRAASQRVRLKSVRGAGGRVHDPLDGRGGFAGVLNGLCDAHGGRRRSKLRRCRLVGLSAMRSGLARAERGGVHSLSTDCGLDLDGPITVSPYDPPPALLSGSRRLARLAGPTPARAWPTYLPLPESTNETSSPSRGQPPVRADSSRPPLRRHDSIKFRTAG